MMRNLPNKYTQTRLLEELGGSGFSLETEIDFFYLPMDHGNSVNLGYCFINFVETSVANNFAIQFQGKKMNHFNSSKRVAVMPASIQGYSRNLAHYSSRRVAFAEDPQFRPIFTRVSKGVSSDSRAVSYSQSDAVAPESLSTQYVEGQGPASAELAGCGPDDARADLGSICTACAREFTSEHRFCAYCGSPVWLRGAAARLRPVGSCSSSATEGNSFSSSTTPQQPTATASRQPVSTGFEASQYPPVQQICSGSSNSTANAGAVGSSASMQQRMQQQLQQQHQQLLLQQHHSHRYEEQQLQQLQTDQPSHPQMIHQQQQYAQQQHQHQPHQGPLRKSIPTYALGGQSQMETHSASGASCAGSAYMDLEGSRSSSVPSPIYYSGCWKQGAGDAGLGLGLQVQAEVASAWNNRHADWEDLHSSAPAEAAVPSSRFMVWDREQQAALSAPSTLIEQSPNAEVEGRCALAAARRPPTSQIVHHAPRST
mmetsp:Transcript_64591/g.135551  ORF Transcript_64591/g.135551 Transcript_64591/m.135551 type:complete len:484 (+) Transcript_64591:3-1454(+)